MASKTEKNALSLFEGMSEFKKETIKAEPEKEINAKPKESRADKKEEKKVLEKRTTEAEEKKTETAPETKIKIILSKKVEKNMKTRSLYMDDAKYEKLQKIAEKNGLSVSETLDEILGQIL